MGAKVSDVLELEIFKQAQLITGTNGLSREVSGISFSDCPIVFSEDEYALTKKGDLYISGLYLYKDNPDKIIDVIKFYVLTKSACCIFTTVAFKELPLDAINFANENNYPIILIPDSVSYTEMISEISHLITSMCSDKIITSKIKRLLFDQLPEEEVLRLAKGLVDFNCANYAVLSFTPISNTAERRIIEREFFAKIEKSRSSLLFCDECAYLIYEFDDINHYNAMLDIIESSVNAHLTNAFCGIGEQHSSIKSFAKALWQAYASVSIGKKLGKPKINYGDEPLAEFIFSTKDNSQLIRFCDSVLRPLREYESKKNVDLVETLSAFISNNGNYKLTADSMFQHINTVRLRVLKAKEILGMTEDDYQFIKEVSLAIDCDKFIRR